MTRFILILLTACGLAGAAFAQTPTQTPAPASAPAPTDAIDASLRAAATDEAAATAFINTFLTSEVWVRVQPETLTALADQRAQGGGDAPIRAFAATLPSGARAIMVFSRPEYAAGTFGAPVPMIGMSGEAAMRLQAQIGVALNYGRAPWVFWSPEQVAAILAGRAAPTVSPPASAPH